MLVPTTLSKASDTVSNTMQRSGILSLGTMYVDVNCIGFPFDGALFANRETVGGAYQLELGGSALNFAKVAAQLDVAVSFLGKAGNDEMGKTLVGLMKQNNIHPLVVFGENVQTNLAVHYIHDDGTSIMTSSGSANQSLSASDIEKYLESAVETVQYVYLGGIFKLKNILPDLPGIVEKIRRKGVRVVLDHGRVNNKVTAADIEQIRALLPHVDIYLPSIDEFLSVWGGNTVQEGIANLRKVAQPLTIVKRGEDGAIGFVKNSVFEVKPYEVTVMNTVGAGDSFNAGFLKAQGDGLSTEASMQLACAVAATKISSADTITIEKVTSLISRSAN